MESVLDRDVYYFLSKVVAQKPKLVILVDEKTPRLEEACRHLNPEIIEFKSFAKNENNHAHLVSRHLAIEIHSIKKSDGSFACLLCDYGVFSGDATQIVEHIDQRHGIEYENQQIEGWDDADEEKYNSKE